MRAFALVTLISLFSLSLQAGVKTRVPFRPAPMSVKDVSPTSLKSVLLTKFKKNLSNPQIKMLKAEVINYSGKAIPALVEVMKSNKYPDKSRWVATFLVGRIMGKKAAPFLSKFMGHPNWVLRMAAMKTLMALKQKQYKKEYAKALKDKSFIVRRQALETIKHLELTDLAPNVWAMLYDKENYYTGKGNNKRTNLIKKAVKTVGDLKFEQARKPLFTMIQKKKYEDIFTEMEYSLQKITGKKAPEQDLKTKRRFWSKVALSFKTF